jgi:hypothetical protein
MRSGDISGRSGRDTWEVETFMAEAGEMHEKWRHLWQKRERHMWSGDISGRSMRSRDIYGRSRRDAWEVETSLAEVGETHVKLRHFWEKHEK